MGDGRGEEVRDKAARGMAGGVWPGVGRYLMYCTNKQRRERVPDVHLLLTPRRALSCLYIDPFLYVSVNAHTKTHITLQPFSFSS